ncbi:hypothetical protein FHQ18_11645 [Deferribacter autotrophicus]|uniref:Phage tail protein n=1 Tax=Deferribacter autotrophicus TaxID=500465 RepID=A0A5A8F1E7_9BACT|nr:hypothetical protein [Deferribacter autotrophicus]KAA0257211.1 hypothetical protein FHQ18_11645 [Deferribacter autotrophicus]
MSYFAGVRTFDIPTSLVPPVRVNNPVVAFGTSLNNPIGPKLIFSFDEYEQVFGYDGDYTKHTLDEVADVAFKLYKVTPVVFVSIGADATDTVNITSTTVIDAINANLDNIFFLFREVPGTLIAPGFSKDPSVAIAMAAAMETVSTLFKGMAIADIPDTIAYADVPNYKTINNLVDDNLILTYPAVTFEGKAHNLSTHLAFQQAFIDGKNEGIPYQVASNQRLLIDGCSQVLTLTAANFLRGNGVVTVLNFIGGFTSWGDRTSVYPGNTDPVECQIPIRRMFNYLNEVLVRTYWQKVDVPLNMRVLKTIRDSVNTMLDGWTAREIINGGRCEILESENPTTDLIDGIARLHIYWAPPGALREIDFYKEYDVNYIQSIVGQL